MNLLILVRDALIALALAWVGVTLSEAENAGADACERTACAAAER